MDTGAAAIERADPLRDLLEIPNFIWSCGLAALLERSLDPIEGAVEVNTSTPVQTSRALFECALFGADIRALLFCLLA